MKIGELFMALGFDVDDKKLKEFDDNVKSGAASLAKMAAVAAGTVYAVNRFVAGSVQSSVELRNFREETGYASEDVERFYNVIGRLNTNVTLDQTAAAFRALSDTISQAKFGEGPISEAAMLGLSDIALMEPMQIIEELRDRFESNVASWGYDRTRDMMSALGLGSEFIMAIKATDEEFNRLWRNPILGNQYRDRLLELAEAQKEFSFQWTILKGELSARISPYFIEWIDKAIPAIDQLISNMEAAIPKVAEFVGGFEHGEETIAALAAAILLRWQPVLALFTALAFAMNEVGKFARDEEGLISEMEKGVLGWSTLMQSDPDSPLGKWKRQIAEKYPEYNNLSDDVLNIVDRNNFTSAPADFLQEDFSRFYQNALSPSIERDRMVQNMMTSQQRIMNNFVNIQTSADARGTFEEFYNNLEDMKNKDAQDNFFQSGVPELR